VSERVGGWGLEWSIVGNFIEALNSTVWIAREHSCGTQWVFLCIVPRVGIGTYTCCVSRAVGIGDRIS